MTAHFQERTKPYTAEDVWLLSIEGQHFELLNGELIAMAPTKQTHGALANWIAYLITGVVISNKLGTVYAAETGFTLGDQVLAPDVSFVARARIQPETRGFATVAPDLLVDVISESSTSVEMQDKIDVFFANGTRLMLVVHPKTRTVYAYQGPKKVTILSGDDVLEGADVLPGFQLKVSEIFSVLDE